MFYPLCERLKEVVHEITLSVLISGMEILDLIAQPTCAQCPDFVLSLDAFSCY
jgi:hypothetical protein